jgi:hypothetical protein
LFEIRDANLDVEALPVKADAGANLGSAALAAFGAIMWLLAQDTAAGSLAIATIAWFALAILLWRLRRQVRYRGPAEELTKW